MPQEADGGHKNKNQSVQSQFLLFESCCNFDICWNTLLPVFMTWKKETKIKTSKIKKKISFL